MSSNKNTDSKATDQGSSTHANGSSEVLPNPTPLSNDGQENLQHENDDKDSNTQPTPFTTVAYIKEIINYYKDKNIKVSSKLDVALKFYNAELDLLEPEVREFLQNISKTKTKPPVDPFSIEDKLLALELFIKSHWKYKYFSAIFSLPTKNSLKRLLRPIPFSPCLVREAFDYLKIRARQFTTKQKVCVLTFGEQDIQPHVEYDPEKDMVIGFVHNGKRRDKDFTDLVQVFMLHGIYKNWKYPLAYNFCSSNHSASNDIVRAYKLVIQKAHAIGLDVVASICVNTDTNIKAIQTLLDESGDSNHDVITIGNKSIIPLYDPPHLLTSFRNHFREKDLVYKRDGKEKRAKWSHIITAHQIDSSRKDGSLLTDSDVFPSWIPRSEFSQCLKVLSGRIARRISFMGQHHTTCPAKGLEMPVEAEETAEILSVFDRLFDSVNGSLNLPEGFLPVLRGPITDVSGHLAIWLEGIEILSTMRFVDKDDCPSVLKCFVSTLNGFVKLKHSLHSRGYNKIPGRHFNIDHLYKFLLPIEQLDEEDDSMTSMDFQYYLKGYLIVNLTETARSRDDFPTKEKMARFRKNYKFLTRRSTADKLFSDDFDSDHEDHDELMFIYDLLQNSPMPNM